MNNKKSTKRTLLTSVLSLVLCMSMLIGTTFAWFTDSVTSGNNIIKSGNLDIELEYYNEDTKEWITVEGASDIFTSNLWEPGHTEVVYLKLTNKGTLALKYQLGVNIVSETGSVNVEGDSFKLSQYIEYGVVEGKEPSYAKREDAVAAVKNDSIAIASGYSKSGNMEKQNDTVYLAMVVYMPDTVGNEANYATGAAVPTINLGVNLVANQYTYEEDSFDNKYDSDAYAKVDIDGIQYVYDGEEVILYLVPDSYTGATVNVVEGCTQIGRYAFYYNSNVETIVLPSTVQTLDQRAFRGTSASTVILNEGLETISYQAFRDAKNLTSIEIPSTVTTIDKEAFQLSGLTSVTIPKTVTSISSSFRDCASLENVTIEGSTEIGIYAFRSCAALKNVYLWGENPTFIGTSMTFTHADTGAANGITIYVRNNTVAAAVKEAQGSAHDYTIVIPTQVASQEAIKDALTSGKDVVFTDDIEASLSENAIYSDPVAIIQKEGGIIDGNGCSLDIKNPQYNGYAIETYGGTIKNLTIDSTVGRGIVISLPKEDIYIDNVIVDGPGYAINTTEHNGKKLIVTNSTIKGWTSLAGLDSVSFTKCAFGENTSKYWQNMGYDQDYDRLVRPYVTATFTDCEFEKGYYIDLSALNAGCTLAITNCAVNGVVLTETNYSQYITIELPSGRTLSDCVAFN